MRLSPDQLAQFDRDGYLFFPRLFTPEEICTASPSRAMNVAIFRPEYIARRDFTPIGCLPDDCLVKPYPVELPWKDGTPASALRTEIAT